jgi:hypothetical protein
VNRPVPGYPHDKRREPVVAEVDQTPRSLPPGAVRLAGNGWKLQVPLAVLLAVGSAIGARLLPTQTSTDVSVERAAIAAARSELQQERWREEQRREFAALRDTMERLDTRISLLEARPKP